MKNATTKTVKSSRTKVIDLVNFNQDLKDMNNLLTTVAGIIYSHHPNSAVLKGLILELFKNNPVGWNQETERKLILIFETLENIKQRLSDSNNNK